MATEPQDSLAISSVAQSQLELGHLASLSLEVGAFCTWACVIEFVRRSNVSALLTDIGVRLGFFPHHD
jgi:hypothetical protein